MVLLLGGKYFTWESRVKPAETRKKRRIRMDAKEMKKILAGVGIAGLLSGLPMGSGVAFGGSG